MFVCIYEYVVLWSVGKEMITMKVERIPNWRLSMGATEEFVSQRNVGLGLI